MKHDINLLFKRKLKKYSSKNVSVLLLIIILIGAVAYAGITLPSGLLQDAKKDAAEVEEILKSSSVDKQELTDKTKIKEELDTQIAELTALKESKADILYYIEAIERSQPSNIILSNIITDVSGKINLLGRTGSDKTIALFCLNLREQEDPPGIKVFKNVSLYNSVTTPETGTITFSIMLTLPSPLDSKSVIQELEQKDDVTSNTAAPGGN